LSSEQREVAGKLFRDGTGRPDGPDLKEGELFLVALELGLQDNVLKA
jgi:hypothetical protein